MQTYKLFSLDRHRLTIRGQVLGSALFPQVQTSFDTLYDSLSACFAAVKPQVKAGSTPFGRGLVVLPNEGVCPDGVLLSVDWANLLAVTDDCANNCTFSKKVLDDWQALHGRMPPLLVTFLTDPTGGDWAHRLAAWLLYIKNHVAPENSMWQMYVDLLPKEEDMSCLMNFEPDERLELQDSIATSLAAEQRAQLLNSHTLWFDEDSGFLKSLKLSQSAADTRWAMCMVNSRCFSESIYGEAVSMIVPLADMANHSNSPNSRYMYDVNSDQFHLVACQALEQGQEALISYGCIRKDNRELMRDYGFVLTANVNDRVPFTFGQGEERKISMDRLLSCLNIELRPGGNLGPILSRCLGDSAEEIAMRRSLVTLLSLQPILSPKDVDPDEEKVLLQELIHQCDYVLKSLPTCIETDEETVPFDHRHLAAIQYRLERKRTIQYAMNVLLERYF